MTMPSFRKSNKGYKTKLSISEAKTIWEFHLRKLGPAGRADIKEGVPSLCGEVVYEDSSLPLSFYGKANQPYTWCLDCAYLAGQYPPNKPLI